MHPDSWRIQSGLQGLSTYNSKFCCLQDSTCCIIGVLFPEQSNAVYRRLYVGLLPKVLAMRKRYQRAHAARLLRSALQGFCASVVWADILTTLCFPCSFVKCQPIPLACFFQVARFWSCEGRDDCVEGDAGAAHNRCKMMRLRFFAPVFSATVIFVYLCLCEWFRERSDSVAGLTWIQNKQTTYNPVVATFLLVLRDKRVPPGLWYGFEHQVFQNCCVDCYIFLC